jgi:hypothetical protein
LFQIFCFLFFHTDEETKTWVRKGVKSVKPAHFNVVPACDGDTELTIGRAETRRPTLDHYMVYVAGKKLKFDLCSC